MAQYYHRLIEGSQLLTDADTAQLDDRIFGCDATSFIDNQCVGSGFLKVGEAAFAIDPLSSSGVQAAIQSALAGSVAVHTMLSKPDSVDVAQCFYVGHVENAATRHAAWAAQHYGEHQYYAAETFWQRRATNDQATVAALESNTVRQHWRSDKCVALSQDVRIEDTPSVVGDFVVWRPAVRDRSLSRPVAFVGGLDLPAFLDRMPPVSRISDVQQALSSVLPRDNVLVDREQASKRLSGSLFLGFGGV